MSNQNLVVPATLLQPIKAGLIKLGYATEATPLDFVQDAYFKYVMITQAGFNPNVPYALGLLPKSIQDQLVSVEEGAGFKFTAVNDESLAVFLEEFTSDVKRSGSITPNSGASKLRTVFADLGSNTSVTVYTNIKDLGSIILVASSYNDTTDWGNSPFQPDDGILVWSSTFNPGGLIQDICIEHRRSEVGRVDLGDSDDVELHVAFIPSKNKVTGCWDVGVDVLGSAEFYSVATSISKDYPLNLAVHIEDKTSGTGLTEPVYWVCRDKLAPPPP